MQGSSEDETPRGLGDEPADEANQRVSNRHSNGCHYLK